MLKKLANLADSLDKKGHKELATKLDSIIKTIAEQEFDELTEDEKQDIDEDFALRLSHFFKLPLEIVSEVISEYRPKKASSLTKIIEDIVLESRKRIQ